MKKLLTTILLSIFSLSVFSQNLEKLNAYFNGLEANQKFMGSVALYKEGKPYYVKSVGFADVQSQEINDKNTQFRVGSISKTFTAVLIFKAVEEGKLSVDQRLDTYFPSIENAKTIRLKNLLNHSSGIHNFTNDSIYMTYNTEPHSMEEMVKIIADAGSEFLPGQNHSYSNSNYVLLSYILEKVYEKPYGEILEEKICNPAGLERTEMGKDIQLAKNQCNSYQFAGTWDLQTETDPSVSMGAGAVISTPTDLVKFLEALFSYQIITQDNVDKMCTLKSGYGSGLFSFPFYGKKGYGHTGGIDGFSSVMAYFPAEKVGIAITCNGSNFSNNDIAIVLLSDIFNEPYEVPDFTDKRIDNALLDQYVGVYKGDNFPLDITVTRGDGVLIAQATNQPSFTLESISVTEFIFKPAGLTLIFYSKKGEMVLKQGMGEYTLIKQ